MLRAAITAAVLLICAPVQAQETELPKGVDIVRVGVLAYRGSDNLLESWESLRLFLDTSVPGVSFEFVPITLVSADALIEARRLDFVVTNPGHFVALSRRHDMSVLASRLQEKSDGSLSNQFGSTVITQKDSDILTMKDVANKRVSAVDRRAFGGFQVAWHEFHQHGIDPFTDFAELSFVGFPMDHVVTRVLEGDSDVGVVRSGLIESLQREGIVGPDDLRVLNSHVDYTHPDQLSTRLYPEWPFIALSHTRRALCDQVAFALVSTQFDPLAAEMGLKNLWGAPLSYQAAEELFVAYEAAIFGSEQNTVTWGASVLVPAMLLMGFSIGFLILHRRPLTVVSEAGAAAEESESNERALTPREKEILDLIAAGLSSKEIAAKLGISPKTVEFHRANLLRKYGAKTSCQLVAMAS